MASVPNDWRDRLFANNEASLALRARRQDLERGTGVYADTAVGAAARELAQARDRLARAEALVHSPVTPCRQHRRATKEADLWRGREATAADRWQRLAGPELSRLDRHDKALAHDGEDLRHRVRSRDDWLSQHPEAAVRIRRLEAEIDALEFQMAPDEWRASRALSRDSLFRQPERTIERGIDFGIDI